MPCLQFKDGKSHIIANIDIKGALDLLGSDRSLYSRRQVLSMGRKALIVVGVCCLYPASRYLTAKENPLAVARIASSVMPLSINWQRLGTTRFWLRQGTNGVEAMWASCTHLGCEVSYDPEEDQWLCPCHGSHYSRDGQPVRGPAVSPLLRAKVKEQDGFYLLQQPAV
jgi:cytochrome b6-f complex iron-sulfur subunit